MDSPHCRTFVDNIQTAFNTKMPPKSVLLQGEAGRGGGDLSAGESPCGSWAGVPSGRGLGTRHRGEPVSTRRSFCREQPAPVPHGGGGQPDGAPDRRGEAQPRAGGPAHAQVGVPRAPGPRGPRRPPPACLPARCRPPSGLGTRSWRRAWRSTSWTCCATSSTGGSPSTASRGTSCGCSPLPAATRRRG